MTPSELAGRIGGDAVGAGVRLLVLHGSQARGEASERSDWDVGYLADRDADIGMLGVAVSTALATDHVDLVDLVSASALLRYRAARDGFVLLEREQGLFLRFQLDATQFWCDVEPVVRAAHHDLLAALG